MAINFSIRGRAMASVLEEDPRKGRGYERFWLSDQDQRKHLLINKKYETF